MSYKRISIPEKFTNNNYLNLVDTEEILIIKNFEKKANKIIFKKTDDFEKPIFVKKLCIRKRNKGLKEIKYFSFLVPIQFINNKVEKYFEQSRGKYLIGVLEEWF